MNELPIDLWALLATITLCVGAYAIVRQIAGISRHGKAEKELVQKLADDEIFNALIARQYAAREERNQAEADLQSRIEKEARKLEQGSTEVVGAILQPSREGRRRYAAKIQDAVQRTNANTTNWK